MSRISQESGKIGKESTLRINATIRGPLAEFANDLRRRGWVRSCPDLVHQSLRALRAELAKQELAIARLDALKDEQEEHA